MTLAGVTHINIVMTLSLFEFMQISSPPDLSDWMAYHAPLIPWLWTFS